MASSLFRLSLSRPTGFLPRHCISLALLIGCLNPLSLVSGQDSDEPTDATPEINSSLLSSFRFRGIGPALMSGRIGDIAVDPVDSSVRYIAAASGGVWKTENAGTTWTPIFDNYGSYSIGCVTVDPNNRFVVWVGTGENNSQRSVGYGDGLYKSEDGGKSFRRVGLENSEHISRIVVHPDDSEVVYVAAQGPLWKEGGDRGLYKTTDGGKTWECILKVSENTGITDIVLDPRDPGTMYAAAYQRRRHVWTLIDGGPESGVHKSTDGGRSWKKLSRGLPGGDVGRIGLAISPMKPDVLYAIVEAAGSSGGFYRSADRGETWSRRSSYVSGSPQYYQELVACPHQFDRVYSMDTYLQVTEDGGRTFSGAGESNKHVDNHALYIDPQDENHLIAGCDGGLYETWDRCRSWRYSANLPLTQFYKIAVSTDKPFYYVYGGTQDNATQGGPSRTNNIHGIRNSDWFLTVFGDGFDPAVDPDDPDTIYSQWQYGGLVRFDRKSGQRLDIKPQADKGGPPLRFNWDSALLISPHDSKTVYYGSQFLHRSRDRGNSWETLGPDLTRQIDRNTLKVMGRVWGPEAVAKNDSTSFYGTIVCAEESPIRAGLLYVGTDDGLVQVSEDAGKTWRKIEKFGNLDVPEFGYIYDIEASRHDADTVYVAVNNHKRGDFKPYVVKSDDRGQTWTLISRDLPERGSAYCLKHDHKDADILFCGTEFGVFVTLDGGTKWFQLKGGIPTIAVRDMEIQESANDLVVGSFGRGFYILDDYSALRELSPELLEEDAAILPIPQGELFLPAAPLSGSGKAYQGASFYVAPNPPSGVRITWYAKDSLRSASDSQRKKGSNGGYPSWESIREERRARRPERHMVIRDARGDVIQTLKVSTGSGLQTTLWDFRYTGFQAVTGGGGGRRGRGPLAVPGKYTAELVNVVEGRPESLTEPVSFDVRPLGWADVPDARRPAILAFQRETEKLQHAVMASYSIANEAQAQLEAMKTAADQTPGLDPNIGDAIHAAGIELEEIFEMYSGDQLRPEFNEPGYPGIMSRLRTVVGGHWSTEMEPTDTHRRNYKIAEEEFEAALERLRPLVNRTLPRLNRQLDAAGARWTPGRPLPEWK